MHIYHQTEIRKFVQPIVDQFLDIDLSLSRGGTDIAIAIVQELIEQGWTKRSEIKRMLQRLLPDFHVREAEAMLNGFKGIHWSITKQGDFAPISN